MPIQYQHNLNPLVSGAMSFWSGRRQAKQAQDQAKIQQQQFASQQRAAQQSQIFGTVSNLASQQLAQQNRIQMAQLELDNAKAALPLEHQRALENWSLNTLGMPWDQFKDQASLAPETPLPQLIDSRIAQVSAMRKGQSLEAMGMEEVESPTVEARRKQIMTDRTAITNEYMQGNIDDDVASEMWSGTVKDEQHLAKIPKIVRAKSPNSVPIAQAEQKGQMWLNPQTGTYFARNRYGEIQEISSPVRQQEQDTPDPVMAGYVELMQQFDAAEQDVRQWEDELRYGPPSRPRPKDPGRRPTPAEYFRSEGIKTYNFKTGAITMVDDETVDMAEVQAKAQVDVAKIQQAARSEQEKGINEAIKTAYEIAKSKSAETPISMEQVEQDARKILELKQRMSRPAMSYSQTIEAIKAQARSGDQKAQQYLNREGISWQN
jgi:hypothetical protein